MYDPKMTERSADLIEDALRFYAMKEKGLDGETRSYLLNLADGFKYRLKLVAGSWEDASNDPDA